MATRIQFRDRLQEVLGVDHLYFQPPSGFKMEYDCCVYKVAHRPAKHADNIRYLNLTQYECTLIFRDPDSDLPQKLMAGFQYVEHNRSFAVDHLNHEIFLVYY